MQSMTTQGGVCAPGSSAVALHTTRRRSSAARVGPCGGSPGRVDTMGDVLGASPETPPPDYMGMAIEEALRGVASGDGGPFGALILHPSTGEVVSLSHNCVLKSNDPTAHAEVVAIRAASAARGTWDLSDCVLYASCRPCPMCYGAAAWAKLPRVEYAARAEDAASVGFDDKAMWDAVGREGGGAAAASSAAAAAGDPPCAPLAMVVMHAAHERKMEPFHAFLKAKADGKSSLY